MVAVVTEKWIFLLHASKTRHYQHLIIHLLAQLVSFITGKTRLKLDLCNACQWLYVFVNDK